MQLDARIQDLLKKYILNQCSKEEVDEVVNYFQGIKKSDQLPSVEDVLALLSEKPELKEADATRIHDNIIQTVQNTERALLKRKRYFWKYAAAASVLVIIALTLFFNSLNNGNEAIEDIQPVIVNSNNIIPGSKKAILTLGDGSVVELGKDSSFYTKSASSDGEEIIYNREGAKPSKIEYNYLTIPRGGEFVVLLSDGTKVWLNSESQFKFPVRFAEGENREVELVYGEAYFDVSPSTEHKGAKFVVINNSQAVEVIGTEFNVKAYKDESNIYTTLVEGKVKVSLNDENRVLLPGQQLDYSKNTNAIVMKNVDVQNEVSWKDGVFGFKNKTLEEIMKVLSRWYDMEVVYENDSIKTQRFVGALYKNGSIEEVLMSIKNSGTINDYKFNDKELILK